ncbi:DHS-like NAD/FAD-binding domain-containing protein [Globomyces pollinis-pini]|nr:DHS-like NAD/FAD-binding domain-containing protein [Globomyces pollinis-pini]
MSELTTKELADLISSSQFVVLTGAGISISAGLKPFRINNKSLNKDKLSSVELQESGNPMKLFNFVAQIAEEARNAKPSKFHFFLKHFALHKQLIRHYTMNVDCLENQVKTRIDGKYTSLKNFTIRLHGEILHSVCFRCSKSYFVTDDILQSWKGKHLKDLYDCNSTECTNPLRKLNSLRILHRLPAKVKPNVVLYDEPLVEEAQERIRNALAEDIAKKPDLLLIVGTSLSTDVHGQFMIINEFKKCRSDIKIVFINPEPPKNPSFHYVVGEADNVAWEILQRINGHLRLNPVYIRQTKIQTRSNSKRPKLA